MKTMNQRNISRISIIVLLLLHLLSGQNRVVGYFPEWRKATFGYSEPAFEHLTHVVLAFAWPTATGNIQSYNGIQYDSFVDAVHAGGSSALLAFGGWGNSDGFSPMSADSTARQNFINNVVDLCGTYGYDGVDFDWEHPANTADEQNYVTLIHELREAFDDDNPDLIITMAISAGSWYGQHYDYESMTEDIEYYTVMTYDYHGTWTSHAGPNSPLYNSPPGDPDGSCHTSMNYILNTRNIPPEKVNLGLAFYGHEFNASQYNGSSTGGSVSPIYSNIIQSINNGWEYYWDDIGKVPYIQNPTHTKVVTFDDTASIRLKCEYALSRNLGGVEIWALGYDIIDDQQILLSTINDNFISIDDSQQDNMPLSYHVMKNYPNPFNNKTQIIIEMANNSQINLSIYSINGQKIKTLFTGNILKGNHTFSWAGLDASNSPVSSGVYIYQLVTIESTINNKMILIK